MQAVWISRAILFTAAAAVVTASGEAADRAGSLPAPQQLESREGLTWLVGAYCQDCHNGQTQEAGLNLQNLLSHEITSQAEVWEKVIRKVSTGQMPPVGESRPSAQELQHVQTWLASELDQAAVKTPNPGRSESFRRLTRREYQSAVRDLLGLTVDVDSLLPADESSHGFDNVTVTGLSPTLVNRYLTAAEKISRLAVGRAGFKTSGETVRIRPDITQDFHIAGLPLGTRGGAFIPYHFPVSGEYEIQLRLMRDRNEEIEGLKEPHDLDVRLDRERIASFKIAPPPNGQSDKDLDANLKTRIAVSAGAHELAVAFARNGSSLLESTRQPLNVHFNYYRHPRLGPAVYEVSIVGPFQTTGSGETISRQKIFLCRPADASQEEECASRILSNLMRRACRGPVSEEDLLSPLEQYRTGREEGDFEAGIERALSAILVHPRFLFKIEPDPAGVASGSSYRLSDVELASRLSFFLWSSIPDEELLALAERGEISRPEVLDSQVWRMLADERSQALVTHFAGQWLHLKNLDSVTPDMRLYPDFDDNLRQAMRKETELLFDYILKEDLSVLELIRADYSFLNERLARHYGIPHVYGSRFRRVDLNPESQRGGLLRHASILTVTSYATRTSPVIRGKWVLENLLGSPPPPPPANVPPLEDNTVEASLSVRERLAAHRENPACASCHNLIDPVGFALEGFDAVGRLRLLEEGKPVDPTGAMPDGTAFVGVEGLEQGLLKNPELLARTVTEKLLTYALGRGLEYHDAPAVRRIVTESARQDYQFSSLIQGIVRSTPFQMRRVD